MKPKVSFELFRWTYYFLFWFVGMVICVPISELVAGPALKWLFYDIPYQLPTWSRIGRMAVLVILFSLFAGSLTWFYEKTSSGR